MSYNRVQSAEEHHLHHFLMGPELLLSFHSFPRVPGSPGSCKTRSQGKLMKKSGTNHVRAWGIPWCFGAKGTLKKLTNVSAIPSCWKLRCLIVNKKVTDFFQMNIFGLWLYLSQYLEFSVCKLLIIVVGQTVRPRKKQRFSIYIYIFMQCEAPKIAKLVYNSNVTMVYGTYNYS